MSRSPTQSVLRRELALPGAIGLGLGSILGAGVFVSIGLVAGKAGAWTVVAVALAALIATCNALSSAQLAANYPRSGGTYEYGYELLHPLAGFVAGWMFLCAKSASAATAALEFSGYVVNLSAIPPASKSWIATAAVIVMTILVASGLRGSNRVNAAIVSLTILTLIGFISAGLPAAMATWRTKSDFSTINPADLLEATALMFVAYTGYGWLATLGEEVKNPRRTIPNAIIATLVVSAALYLCVAMVAIMPSEGQSSLKQPRQPRHRCRLLPQSLGCAVFPPPWQSGR